jgi:hypothetical protein
MTANMYIKNIIVTNKKTDVQTDRLVNIQKRAYAWKHAIDGNTVIHMLCIYAVVHHGN